MPYFRQQFICHLLSASNICRLCFLKVCPESSSLLLPPSLVYSKHSTLCAACPFQFLVYYYVLFCFLWGGGQSVHGDLLVYPRGGCGSTMFCLFAHLLVCVSQAGLELVSGGTGALLLSQCNMAWGSFVWAGGSGCQSFVSSW
jgi:hypothetical protein